jgi:hypothetical protein
MINPDIVASSDTESALRQKIFQAEAHWHFKDGWLYKVRADDQRLRASVITPDQQRDEKVISSSPDKAGAEMFSWLQELHRQWRKRNKKLDADDIIPT